jgi:hypothetical protein
VTRRDTPDIAADGTSMDVSFVSLDDEGIIVDPANDSNASALKPATHTARAAEHVDPNNF